MKEYPYYEEKIRKIFLKHGRNKTKTSGYENNLQQILYFIVK